MQYEAKTPKEYLEVLEDDWRRHSLQALREVILQEAPELSEQMNYEMLGFRDDEGFVFHLNAQKHYVSFYVGNIAAIDSTGKLLKGLNTGKSCIRFSKTKVVDSPNIRQFITQAMHLRKQGIRFDC